MSVTINTLLLAILFIFIFREEKNTFAKAKKEEIEKVKQKTIGKQNNHQTDVNDNSIECSSEEVEDEGKCKNKPQNDQRIFGHNFQHRVSTTKKPLIPRIKQDTKQAPTTADDKKKRNCGKNRVLFNGYCYSTKSK